MLYITHLADIFQDALSDLDNHVVYRELIFLASFAKSELPQSLPAGVVSFQYHEADPQAIKSAW